MKLPLLIACFILIFSKVQSQIIVANVKMNIVYAGVDNPIEFLANNIDKNKLVIKASCGQLTRITAGKYSWKICDLTCSYVSFSIGILKNNKFLLLGKSDYRIKSAPAPKINFGSTPESRQNNHFGSVIKLPQFGPRLDLYNFDFDVKCEVRRFDVEIVIGISFPSPAAEVVDVAGPSAFAVVSFAEQPARAASVTRPAIAKGRRWPTRPRRLSVATGWNGAVLIVHLRRRIGFSGGLLRTKRDQLSPLQPVATTQMCDVAQPPCGRWEGALCSRREACHRPHRLQLEESA